MAEPSKNRALLRTNETSTLQKVKRLNVIRVDVLFLGPARGFAKTESVWLELPDATTVAQLRDRLLERFPALHGAMGSIRFAVNEAFANDDNVLQSGDEVALIPPVSGGQAEKSTERTVGCRSLVEADGMLVGLVAEAIPAERVRSFITGQPTLGGIVTFEGATRHESDDDHGALVYLEYESYESMARRELMRLAREVTQRWSVGRVAIVHRLGRVRMGEVSVMISVACPHRSQSFEACRFLIDTLKKDVPIWW